MSAEKQRNSASEKLKMTARPNPSNPPSAVLSVARARTAPLSRKAARIAPGVGRRKRLSSFKANHTAYQTAMKRRAGCGGQEKVEQLARHGSGGGGFDGAQQAGNFGDELLVVAAISRLLRSLETAA